MSNTQGTPRSSVQNFASLDAFYGAVAPRLRQFSPELDYGVHWTDPPFPDEIPGALPRWRVSWVERTGELYAVCDRADATGHRPVRVYGVVHGRAEIEGFLEGWSDHCGPGGLAWLEGHFAERARSADPFPLLEEITDPRGLPTVDEWLDAGAPLREITPDPDQDLEL